LSASSKASSSRRSLVARQEAAVAAPASATAFDVVSVLSAVQETAYHWDVTGDRIEWESNAEEVLKVADRAAIATGSTFQFLIAPEHAGRRQAAMMKARIAGGQSATYRVQYRFMPDGRRADAALWLEDHGCWWPGPEGLPAHARGVLRVITEGYREEQRLLYRSDRDELTGQLNRVALCEALEATIAGMARSKRPAAFLMAAVDHLAVINDTFGFDVGDEILAATARTMKGKLRGSDAIGRYSSNKFGIVLPDCGLNAMRIAAERLMRTVRSTAIPTSACQLYATISIGGVLLAERSGGAKAALSGALHGLGRAKQKRHDCFVVSEQAPARESERKKNGAIADQVLSALEENRMALALQPIVRTDTRELAFYECLLRIEGRDGVCTVAGEFMQVAEQLRLARFIDRRTLELAVDLLKNDPALTLSLNVSGLTASDHEWLVAVHRLTGGRRQITGRLIVEITETAALQGIEQTMAFVVTLKELGCRVAIDDFGAGYTSFKNLKLLDVDMVKIDGSFVANLAADPHDRVFVKALRDLAASFGIETVAEWVGDDRSAGILAELGITYLQGYMFGQPLSPRDLPGATGA
jgi:diguanylate cyclase (GGDEF)-like protein